MLAQQAKAAELSMVFPTTCRTVGSRAERVPQSVSSIPLPQEGSATSTVPSMGLHRGFGGQLGHFSHPYFQNM